MHYQAINQGFFSAQDKESSATSLPSFVGWAGNRKTLSSTAALVKLRVIKNIGADLGVPALLVRGD